MCKLKKLHPSEIFGRSSIIKKREQINTKLIITNSDRLTINNTSCLIVIKPRGPLIAKFLAGVVLGSICIVPLTYARANSISCVETVGQIQGNL